MPLTLLDLRGNIPCFIHVSHGKLHDVTVLDQLPIEPGAYYVMDRGYVDFERLHRFTRGTAFFVTRPKRNLDFTRRAQSSRRQDDRLAQRPDDCSGGPEVVAQLYPDPLAARGVSATSNTSDGSCS